MISKGIRGAITVDNNTEEDIKNATIEILSEMVLKNNLDLDMISHVIFTLTDDLNAAFPAKFARVDLHWKDVPMMCYNELKVQNALKKCLRVLIVVNCGENFVPEFVYLKGASELRK